MLSNELKSLDSDSLATVSRVFESLELKSVTQFADKLDTGLAQIASCVRDGNSQSQKTMEMLINTNIEQRKIEAERAARFDNELNRVGEAISQLACKMSDMTDIMAKSTQQLSENQIRVDVISKGMETTCAKVDACILEVQTAKSLVDKVNGRVDVLEAKQESNKELAGVKIDATKESSKSGVDWLKWAFGGVCAALVGAIVALLKGFTNGG